jgi:hypothetical protein
MNCYNKIIFLLLNGKNLSLETRGLLVFSINLLVIRKLFGIYVFFLFFYTIKYSFIHRVNKIYNG